MENKLKNILSLSKVLIKENDNNLKLIDEENNRFNTKSVMFWVLIILVCGISYISYEIINYLLKIGKPEIFLNGYFLFLDILLIFQSIMMSMNIFYFSKDIENILPLPFKPIEILISKFNTLIFMLYQTELLFALIPFIIYGMYANMGILFFINLILVLIIFPIFIALIVSSIMMILMKTIKLFKNKDLMQLIISCILMIFIAVLANKAIEYVFNNQEEIENNSQIVVDNINNKIIEINNYLLIINPTVNILQQKNILKIIGYFLELILINLIGFFIFIFMGNKLYLKQLLKANFYFKNKKEKKLKLNKKIKKNKIGISYIKKEFKLLLKNPLFFMQSICPIILTTIMVAVLIIILVPEITNILLMEENRELLSELKFDIEAVCIIVGLTQIVGLLNYSSITAFSREGKNAFVIKYLPISLHKQIMYKNIPQIFVNTICTIILLAVIAYEIPAIELNYIFIIFGLSFLMILINSFILSLIDLLMPKINWDSEYEILKNNKNKLLQYVLIIFNILFLLYIKNVFEDYNLNNSLIIFAIILIVIFIIINLIINKFKNKLFNKIN